MRITRESFALLSGIAALLVGWCAGGSGRDEMITMPMIRQE